MSEKEQGQDKGQEEEGEEVKQNEVNQGKTIDDIIKEYEDPDLQGDEQEIYYDQDEDEKEDIQLWRPPNPNRFEQYYELQDNSGFYIIENNKNKYFYFDDYGGWYDEWQNYYDKDGNPIGPPSAEKDDIIDILYNYPEEIINVDEKIYIELFFGNIYLTKSNEQQQMESQIQNIFKENFKVDAQNFKKMEIWNEIVDDNESEFDEIKIKYENTIKVIGGRVICNFEDALKLVNYHMFIINGFPIEFHVDEFLFDGCFQPLCYFDIDSKFQQYKENVIQQEIKQLKEKWNEKMEEVKIMFDNLPTNIINSLTDEQIKYFLTKNNKQNEKNIQLVYFYRDEEQIQNGSGFITFSFDDKGFEKNSQKVKQILDQTGQLFENQGRKRRAYLSLFIEEYQIPCQQCYNCQQQQKKKIPDYKKRGGLSQKDINLKIPNQIQNIRLQITNVNNPSLICCILIKECTFKYNIDYVIENHDKKKGALDLYFNDNYQAREALNTLYQHGFDPLLLII